MISPPQPPKPQSKSSVEIVSDQLESNREENDYSWQILQQPEADRPDQTLVVMSKPAIGKIGKRRRLIISCIDNITRLQILLPNDSATLRADVSLRNNNDHDLLSGTWRIVSNNLVGPGLGLESIDIIRKLFNQTVVKVTSKNSNLDGLLFDLTDLATASAPLQKACHWSR
jgi:type VI secretion system protein VasI